MSSHQKIKLFQLGGYDVGKTSIAERFFKNKFQQNYIMTVGIIPYAKTIKIDDFIITIKMQDTAGQERYNAIAKNLVKETDGLIFTFDMTSKESFEMISNLLINTNDVVNLADKPLILMGNKIDKANSIVITQKDVDDLINKFKNYKISFFKTSAKTGENINEAFATIIEQILDNNDIDIEKEKIQEVILNKVETSQPPKEEEEEDGAIGTKITRKRTLSKKEKKGCCS